MTPVMFENESNSTTFLFDNVQWSEQAAYRCHICLSQDDDGGISAIVLNLPGAGSSGANEEEALENVKDAICGVIESFKMDAVEIPWQDSDMDGIPVGAKLIWILVNA